MKVAVVPTWTKPDNADGGIRRLIEAAWKYLPQFDIEPVIGWREADVVWTHGTMVVDMPPDRPIVSTCHGLMWSRYEWPAWAHEVNREVVRAMARAQFHTAPSEWVAKALRRGMLVYPEVVYHGVDSEEWTPSGNWRPTVLWNKARADPVSDPYDLIEVAKRLPNVAFQSTIAPGPAPSNIQILGVMPVGDMREIVRNSGVYLATARETFGIGTLEAMSCGVPVVGWNWGGQSEIVKHGETGFLAEPGDYEALAEGLQWALENRDVLGANARHDVVARWGWERRIEQYADLFKRARSWWDAQAVKVSVVVTTHNLARYLGDSLASVAAQDFQDWECLVIDDASTDDPVSIVRAQQDSRFRYLRTPENLKLPGARNFGFTHAKGRYILFLDADDMLAEHALLTLAGVLDRDPSIHVAYGHLDTVSEDGSNRQRNSWPFAQYSWRAQMAHLNQLPYSALMRREVMERTGGYRSRHWRAEDAPLWILASSFGFKIQKVTEAATLIYRWRSDSKSQGEPGDGDWTLEFPWRLGADNGKDGAALMRTSVGHPNEDMVPWSAQGDPPPGVRFWPVPDRVSPRISVLIPVGPGHEKYVIDALDSLLAQTFQDWEAIVVNATGKPWPSADQFDSPVAGCPWAKVIDPGQLMRPSQARNLAARHAVSEAIFLLDADDMLLSNTLEEMYAYHIGTGGGLIYTDWLKAESDPREPMQMVESDEFRCGDVLIKMRHAMTCLIPKWAHEEVEGYNETMPGWEDWDYLIALQAAGVCSYRVPIPGFVYRFRTGTIREDSFGKKDAILKLIRRNWADYYERRKTMPCGGCPGKAKASINPSSNPALGAKMQAALEGPMTLLAYQGPGEGKVTIRGPITNTVYVFHRNEPKYVISSDAEVLLGRSRKGKPDFLTVQKAPERQRIRVPVEITGPPVMPDFPEMPGPDPRKTDDMTIAQISSAAVDAEDAVLLQWLQEERAGKNRVGAIRILEEKLTERASPEPA